MDSIKVTLMVLSKALVTSSAWDSHTYSQAQKHGTRSLENPGKKGELGGKWMREREKVMEKNG